MRRNRQNWMILLFGIAILSITLGYAYLHTDLSINGITNVSSANWNIYWNNIQYGSDNVTDVTTPATIQSGSTEVMFSVSFAEIGDTYEFTVDAVNDGTMNAMVDTVTSGVYAANGTTPKDLPVYLDYVVAYSDGVPIEKNHLLEAGENETYKVRVHFKEETTASQLPSTADNFVFKFSVTYVQATSSAVTRPVANFSTDSWDRIVSTVHNGFDAYNVGDTKEVDMGSLGTHTLRIANTSTPSECSTAGFSQTACGFVLEFADIITTHRMNSYLNGDTTTIGLNNKGGWEYSDMRAYLNSTTYAYENIDYSTTGVYSFLPEVLRNAIIDTRVVSGHGSMDTTNFTTIDKLYLLSTHEVWEDDDENTSSGIDYYDTAYNNTRQLDYYEWLNVTTSRYSGAKKQMNGSNYWWLRSASSIDVFSFSIVYTVGSWGGTYVFNATGVSPAFRLG